MNGLAKHEVIQPRFGKKSLIFAFIAVLSERNKMAKNNWEIEFNKEFPGKISRELLLKKNVLKFIRTEIISKIIEDIPDEWNGQIDLKNFTLPYLKQQLKDKWL